MPGQAVDRSVPFQQQFAARSSGQFRPSNQMQPQAAMVRSHSSAHGVHPLPPRTNPVATITQQQWAENQRAAHSAGDSQVTPSVSAPQTTVTKFGCYNCNSEGHFQRDCPYPMKRRVSFSQNRKLAELSEPMVENHLVPNQTQLEDRQQWVTSPEEMEDQEETGDQVESQDCQWGIPQDHSNVFG